MPRRRRSDDPGILRDGGFFGLVLFERLPRREPVSRREECMALGRAFVEQHRHTIDAQIEKLTSGQADFGLVLDVLTDEALAWARATTGIDFLTHEPCPY